MPKPLYSILLSLVFICSAAQAEVKGEILIGLIDSDSVASDFIRSTVEGLEKSFSPLPVRLEKIPNSSKLHEFTLNKYDFLISSPASLPALPEMQNRIIASAGSSASNNLGLPSGGTILVPSKERTIQDLSDLRGKTVASTLPNDLAGWLSIEYEFKKRGLSTSGLFKRVDFVQHPIPDIFNQVLTGAADAAFLPSCLLERAESLQIIPKGSLRVINEKTVEPTSCRRSTDLYPGLVFLSTPKTTLEASKKAALTILALSPVNGTEWINGADFSKLHELLRELQLGPYIYLRNNGVIAFIKAHIFWFLGALALLIFLIINERRLNYLVRKRTVEIQEMSEHNLNLEKELSSTRNKILTLEHSTIVSELSSLVVHEFKQPLASISNHINILKTRCNEALNDDELSEESMEAVEKGLERIGRILNRVRAYAKDTAQPQRRCSLLEICQKAIDDCRFDKGDSYLNVRWKTRENTEVLGASDELQLVLLNLLKNAAAASNKKTGSPPITISIKNKPQPCVEIENGGQVPDEQQVKEMNQNVVHLKSTSGGLGIGVALIKKLAERNHALVFYELRGSNRLLASLIFKERLDVK